MQAVQLLVVPLSSKPARTCAAEMQLSGCNHIMHSTALLTLAAVEDGQQLVHIRQGGGLIQGHSHGGGVQLQGRGARVVWLWHPTVVHAGGWLQAGLGIPSWHDTGQGWQMALLSYLQAASQGHPGAGQCKLTWRRFTPWAAASATTLAASPTVILTVSKKAASVTPRPSFLAPAG